MSTDKSLERGMRFLLSPYANRLVVRGRHQQGSRGIMVHVSDYSAMALEPIDYPPVSDESIGGRRQNEDEVRDLDFSAKWDFCFG